jgi:hypothetical protein
VRVNGRVVDEARLHFGDELAIGPVLFRLDHEEAETRPSAVTNAGRPAAQSTGTTAAQRHAASARTDRSLDADPDVELIPVDDI